MCDKCELVLKEIERMLRCESWGMYGKGFDDGLRYAEKLLESVP